jgi:signal transduction histidine kinase/CHASE3 domain sensor protein
MTLVKARPEASLHEAPHKSPSAFWGITLLAFVGLTLLGSVAIPARQTILIARLMRKTTDVLAPARLLVEEIQSGLAEEFAALQGYALSGNGALLPRYRATADDDDRRVTALERLATRFDTTATRRARALRTDIGDWRRLNDTMIAQRGSRDQFAAALVAGQARYDSSLSEISKLSSFFTAETAARDDRIRALEHLSIVVNAALVLAALVATCGVLVLVLRERRLSAALHRRIAEESALRQLARRLSAVVTRDEALAGAYTADEVMQRIVRDALDSMRARGAFVEQIVVRADDPPDVVVCAAAGTGVPPLGSTCQLHGSYTELVTTSGEPALIADLAQRERSGTLDTMPDVAGSAIVVPLGDVMAPMGALCVLHSARGSFRSDDLARAGIFGNLAALAYEKARLLEAAQERRRALERVIQSRSRLMRGFSHDVKNPIGAADGFAELLSIGVYGELSARQAASIARMRSSIRAGLALINELHELASAETGTIALSSEPVDLADLVHTLGEEYSAAALARGLALSVDAGSTRIIITTDGARVRQVASNLLSNALKYTAHGSVLVRARQMPAEPFGDAVSWALVEVTDTGPGIPPDKKDYIFEEFSRLGGGDTPGAGLGLAISKLLAQALGGRITVESEVGRGSTFTLWLPLQRRTEDS